MTFSRNTPGVALDPLAEHQLRVLCWILFPIETFREWRNR